MEKTTISSEVGCRSAGGAYTRAEGPREALVVEGAMEPEKRATLDDCKFRRGVNTSDVGWSLMSKLGGDEVDWAAVEGESNGWTKSSRRRTARR
jgi:hypothetical protein